MDQAGATGCQGSTGSHGNTELQGIPGIQLGPNLYQLGQRVTFIVDHNLNGGKRFQAKVDGNPIDKPLNISELLQLPSNELR